MDQETFLGKVESELRFWDNGKTWMFEGKIAFQREIVEQTDQEAGTNMLGFMSMTSA